MHERPGALRFPVFRASAHFMLTSLFDRLTREVDIAKSGNSVGCTGADRYFEIADKREMLRMTINS